MLNSMASRFDAGMVKMNDHDGVHSALSYKKMIMRGGEKIIIELKTWIK